MRIVKPYGRSHVAPDTDANIPPRRQLRQNETPETSRNIPAFAATHDALIIAQWISVIDKIATKPSGKNGPTTAQQDLRRTLGNAAWEHLIAHNLLPAAANDAEKEELRLLWQSKIAPWDSGAKYKPQYKNGKPLPEPSPKGRWYDRFTGIIAPDIATDAITPDDASKIAAEIHDHLYVAARRIDPARENRRRGLIADRAHSIANNTLKPGDHAPCGWNEDDQATYKNVGDVAFEIHKAAQTRLGRRNTPGKPQRLPRDLAAKILYDQYGRIFGKIGIQDAQKQKPGLFALHTAIRDCYRRILRDYRKQDILRILPRDMDALFRLIAAQHRNRDINALIRLGKVIHYQANENNTTPGQGHGVVANWPSKTDIKTSRFWGSDGQANIKRHEAFVRVWRHVIALAARTLKDWADPVGDKIADDILSNESAIDDIFDSARHRTKCGVLFGTQAGHFQGDIGFEKSVLKQAIKRTASLRHTTFHFKGRERFLQEMQGLSDDMTSDVLSAITTLWQDDENARDQQVIATLQAVCADYFLNEPQNRHLYTTLTAPDARSGSVPLPRLRRVLERHDNARTGKDRLPLPPCPNRAGLAENPPLLCQYSILKMLYDGPFRRWLEQRGTDDLNNYINRAIDRTNQAAQDLNGKNRPDDERHLITARANDLPGLAKGEKLAAFLSRLTAATATEMRVQRGYDSDASAARKQAGFIGDLECDVMALAFVDFITDNGFDHIAALNRQTAKSEQPCCDLTGFHDPANRPESNAEPWQQVLYFILHLVPVDEASRLLHQIRKWQVLERGAGDDTARPLRDVMILYLDMHDAKFTGGDALHGIERFSALFEHAADFRAVFPPQSPLDHDRSIPRRGLREIMRFGHFPVLEKLRPHDDDDDRRITHQHVTDWQTARTAGNDGKTPVARTQEQREKLHEKAVRKTRFFTDDDIGNYARSLADVIRHRHLSAHVTLSDDVRLHRLMMGVLGRLADFAGLWERDLYFVLLALMHHHDQSPDTVFKGQGKKLLGNGQIVEALRNKLANIPPSFANDLSNSFPHETNKDIRNDLLHFNMLQNGKMPDLTHCINATRTLMAYDRKLKNAVTRSVIEMLAREKVKLTWEMDDNHQLHGAALHPLQAEHFKNARLKINRKIPGKPIEKYVKITENLHSDHLIRMVAQLFVGTAHSQPDITAPSAIDGLCIYKGKPTGKNR